MPSPEADREERAPALAAVIPLRAGRVPRAEGAAGGDAPPARPSLAGRVLPSLKQRALRAGAWSSIGYGLSQAIRLGNNLIMTRLLAPDMFGVMAIATMVTVILGLLSDIGLQQNIVQSHRGDDPLFLDTAWVVQIVRGVGLWLVSLILALTLYVANAHGLFPGGSVYASPQLPLVIALTAFGAVVSGFTSTKLATAHRTFNQQRVVQIEIGGQLAALVVMVIIGTATHSIWALVAGGLVSTITGTVLTHTWLEGHANRLRSDKTALKDLSHFGKWVFISSAVGVFAINGDRLMLGGVVDPHTLGSYAIAVMMIGAIEGLLTRLFTTISLPALSEVARSDRSGLREAYYKLRIPGDLLLLFAAGGLYEAGHIVIDTLYDPRYAQAGAFLQILALSLIVVRYGVAHQLYLAIGMPRYLSAINVLRFIALFTIVPLLYYFGGLNAAIWGIALHGLATVPFVYYFNGKLGLNDARRELWVLAAFPAGLACGAVVNLLLG